MRYQLTFWICLTVVMGYCFPIVAQEAAQPATPTTQEASAKKKKNLKIFQKLRKTVKATTAFLNYTRKKRTSIAKFSPPNWINLFCA